MLADPRLLIKKPLFLTSCRTMPRGVGFSCWLNLPACDICQLDQQASSHALQEGWGKTPLTFSVPILGDVLASVYFTFWLHKKKKKTYRDKTSIASEDLRRGTETYYLLLPAVGTSQASRPVCSNTSSVWLRSNRWASLFMDLPPRALKCCSIKSTSRHILLAVVAGILPPSPIPSSLSWTIEPKLAIHYVWRSLT